MSITVEEVVSALKHVKHPAAGKDIVELGMVDHIHIDGLEIAFTLTFAKAKDPMKNSIVSACEKALRYYVHPDVDPKIEIQSVQQIQQTPSSIPQAKNIIAVASGKGGVGKSTVAVNLSVALAKMGYQVGLLDADVYGPSIPKMLGVEGVAPGISGEEGSERIIPVERYGVRMLSIGFFVRPEDAVIWRGPMATSALKQLLHQGEWGDLDYLLIDLPPGTGDIHLTIVQELPVTGAVIVSTPQQVALLDVVKGINMFRNEKVNVPILGLVENMAWFTPEELPQNRYYLFGKDACKQLAEREHLRLLGQIPIVQSISESGDIGQPVAADENTITGKAFMDLAANVVNATNDRNENMAATQPVSVK
ncbi:MAG: Mrp/NBP35 family ATP-binding protein [Bacteroidales bacterium]|jgi:ATP-binding protein involved in chromosome partitioning|nr:Mrp/NBP35 family ATP-binding protein [Bacteroidales bacterium]